MTWSHIDDIASYPLIIWHNVYEIDIWLSFIKKIALGNSMLYSCYIFSWFYMFEIIRIIRDDIANYQLRLWNNGLEINGIDTVDQSINMNAKYFEMGGFSYIIFPKPLCHKSHSVKSFRQEICIQTFVRYWTAMDLNIWEGNLKILTINQCI